MKFTRRQVSVNSTLFFRLAFSMAVLGCVSARPGFAGLSASTQLCWGAPHTTTTDNFLGNDAFAQCSFTGSASVTTPGVNGNQIFNGTAFAQADPNVWKVSYDVSVSNYMRDMYQWSSTASSAQTAPTTAVATAQLTDTLHPKGSNGVYNLAFLFSVDGSLSSTDPTLFQASFCTSLFMPQGVGHVISFCRQPGQAIPSTFTLTYSDLLFGGPLTPTLLIQATGFIQPLDPSQVGTGVDTIINGSMHANFGSTIHLDSVLITDANGDPIPGAGFDSDSGITYPVSPLNAVPEPPGLGLTGLTMMTAVGWIRRRRA